MSINNKQWLGLPLNLLWGYIAIAVFMTGDGFELAFLSHYIKALGFSPAEASFAFTLYGLAAALSAWIATIVIAEDSQQARFQAAAGRYQTLPELLEALSAEPAAAV